MTLTAKDVEEITRLLEQSSFDELYLELEGVKLSLRRGAQQPNDARSPVASEGPSAPRLATSADAPAPHSAPAQPVGPVATGEAPAADAHEVVAPLLGTFYRAPKPGAPPFIEVGASVEEETIIGIIEVMKLMNTVRAGVRGRVREILAADGVLVEYGEALIRVDKSSAA